MCYDGCMFIDCNQLTPSQIYFLLIQTVIPRPIAWVLSESYNGAYNLAPFSFFNVVGSHPPIVMLSIGWKDEKERKDTWVNIKERKDFVVHIPSVEHIKEVVASSAALPHGTSEINSDITSLEKLEGQRLPRIKSAKVAMFCEKFAIHEIGSDPQALILGQVNHIWFSDDIVERKNDRIMVHQENLNPLSRLGGNDYASLGKILSIPRPD